MSDFSSIVPDTHQNVSSGYVEMLIQDQRQELFTGLMRMRYSSGENLIFTFLEGTQQRLYRCFEASTEIVSRQAWPQVLNRPISSVGLLPLTVEGLRLIRIAHEAPVSRVERATLSFQEMIDSVGIWAVNSDPSIVHMRSEKISRIYLFSGNSNPIIEELSVVDGQARFSVGDASFPQTLPKVEYNVVRYASNRDHDTWREYELRLAFSPLIRMLVTRFGELAGRILSERLCEQLSAWIAGGGWNINLTANGAVNRQYFDSLEAAIRVYVGIIRRFQDEAGLAIGSRLAENLSRETLEKLDDARRDILTQYIYAKYGFSVSAFAEPQEAAQS